MQLTILLSLDEQNNFQQQAKTDGKLSGIGSDLRINLHVQSLNRLDSRSPVGEGTLF